MSSLDKGQLPAILCLHGRGANATVLQVQARRITYNMRQTFRFIFAEAPFESEAGPGVLPVFEEEGPFSAWTSHRTIVDLQGDRDKDTEPDTDANYGIGQGVAEFMPPEDRENVLRALDAAVEDDGSTWDNVVGVLGFSSGARLATGLLLHQLLSDRFDDPTFGTGIKTEFQFGIILGGQYPPLIVSEYKTDVEPSKLRARLERDYEVLKTIPTVHAWGRSDPWLGQCQLLHAVCKGETCYKMDYEGGHHLPLKDSEANELCFSIRRAHGAAEARQYSGYGG